ncbi:11202_t:CDS:1, partial [Acaulospora colombiana]
EVDWKLTLEMLSPTKITSPHTDHQDHRNRTFRIKTWIKEHPTMAKLNTRLPE